MGGVTKEEGALKLVHPGGFVEVRREPVVAARVMEENPRHCVTRPDVFKFPWIVVSPDSVLTPGKVFYIVPNRTIYRLLRRLDTPGHPDPSSPSPSPPSAPPPLVQYYEAHRRAHPNNDQLPRPSPPVSQNGGCLDWLDRPFAVDPDPLSQRSLGPRHATAGGVDIENVSRSMSVMTLNGQASSIVAGKHSGDRKKKMMPRPLPPPPQKSCLKKPGGGDSRRGGRRVTFVLAGEQGDHGEEEDHRNLGEDGLWETMSA